MKTNIIFRKAAAFALAAALLATPAFAADFTDRAQIAHSEAVSVLSDLDVIRGRPDGSFGPQDSLSRAEMATMLSRLLNSDPGQVPDSGFSDVTGHWAKRYIDHCASLGLVSGIGGGVFAPDEMVTGSQAAAMLLAAARYDTSAFPGDWVQQANAGAAESGLYIGFTADPAAPLTRDGAALLLYNALELMPVQTLNLGGNPTGIAALADGSLLFTDAYHRAVYRLQDGQTELYAGMDTGASDVNGRPLGGYRDSAAQNSLFALPWAIAPFLDGWAVSDAENNVIRLIKDGQVQIINASGGKPLAYPTGLAAGEDGCLYVSDTHNGLIRRISAGGTMTTVASNLQDPMGLCWSDGILYIAETGANRIVQWKDGKLFAMAGNGTDGWADSGAGSAQFSMPQGVAAGSDGSLYIADTGNSSVRIIQNGHVTTLLRQDAADALYPVSPTGLLAVGHRLYVCDSFTGMLLTLFIP